MLGFLGKVRLASAYTPEQIKKLFGFLAATIWGTAQTLLAESS
jgi:hypothetical protein